MSHDHLPSQVSSACDLVSAHYAWTSHRRRLGVRTMRTQQEKAGAQTCAVLTKAAWLGHLGSIDRTPAPEMAERSSRAGGAVGFHQVAIVEEAFGRLPEE